MKTAESKKKGTRDRILWNPEREECLERFWTLLLDGVSAEKMAIQLGADFLNAPTAPQIRTLFKDRQFKGLLAMRFDEDEVTAALRLRNEKVGAGLRTFTFDVPEGQTPPPPNEWSLGRKS